MSVLLLCHVELWNILIAGSVVCGDLCVDTFDSMSYVQDAVVVNSDNAEQAVCEKVGQGVRGLTGHDVMPYLSCEVASCGQHMRPCDVGNDVVDRTLRETKTANWCRTARSLIPLFINGSLRFKRLAE